MILNNKKIFDKIKDIIGIIHQSYKYELAKYSYISCTVLSYVKNKKNAQRQCL